MTNKAWSNMKAFPAFQSKGTKVLPRQRVLPPDRMFFKERPENTPSRDFRREGRES